MMQLYGNFIVYSGNRTSGIETFHSAHLAG